VQPTLIPTWFRLPFILSTPTSLCVHDSKHIGTASILRFSGPSACICGASLNKLFFPPPLSLHALFPVKVTCGRDNIRFWRVRDRALRSSPVDLMRNHNPALELVDVAFAGQSGQSLRYGRGSKDHVPPL
jgi:hypothetical protein